MGRQYNADSSPRHMLRTLVVDDHDAVRKAICQLLRSQSAFEVVCEVADGFEVRRTEELQPDVVVLDISMPNLNGIEAARHIRRVATGAEILFLTPLKLFHIRRVATWIRATILNLTQLLSNCSGSVKHRSARLCVEDRSGKRIN